MPEYLEDPSVLTKEKLKIELLANNVVLPNGDQRKDVYVQLYLKNLTVQNKKIPSSDTFSSDEELQPPPVAYIKSHSGRKATRKTDKPRPEDLDVTGLTIEGLKDELLKYGVKAGPIVASTRKLYEKRLQKLLDQGPPGAVAPPPAITQVDSNHNGNSDSDRFSDKEDEVTTVPEPEPVPVVERTIRSRGKIPTPVTTRTRSSQHHQTHTQVPTIVSEQDQHESKDDLQYRGRQQKKTQNLSSVTPVKGQSSVFTISKEPWVEKIAAGEQTPNRLDEKDLLKQMFPYETDTPTGINATCRRPIRGAAGRPVKSSDLWTDETLLRSASNSYTESHTSTVHRVTTLPPSSRLLTLAPPPTGKAVAPRRGLPVWLQLLLLSVVAGFIFFVYQTMEANPLNPFRAADSAKAVDHDQ